MHTTTIALSLLLAAPYRALAQNYEPAGGWEGAVDWNAVSYPAGGKDEVQAQTVNVVQPSIKPQNIVNNKVHVPAGANGNSYQLASPPVASTQAANTAISTKQAPVPSSTLSSSILSTTASTPPDLYGGGNQQDQPNAPKVTAAPTGKDTLGYVGTGCGGDVDVAAKCNYPGDGKGTSGTLTVTFINSMGKDLFMSFGDNDGGVGAVGMSTSTAVLGAATPHVAEFAPGWAGRVAVGHGIDSCGTKFEGSNIEYPDFDVSYVDGYTVPMVCSEDSLNNPPLRGCNVELFDQGIKCSDEKDDNGKICLNTSRSEKGCDEPEEFFHACAQSAYVFPLDDCANVFKTSNTLVCCVGSSCPAAVSQPNQSGSSSKNNGDKTQYKKRSTLFTSDLGPMDTAKKTRRHMHAKRHAMKAHVKA